MESFEVCVEKIKNNKLSDLREFDQLLQEKNGGKVFFDFVEAKIKFAPTYKFKVGTSDYEYKEKKVRIPAWCDRILFRGQQLNQLFYSSVVTPTISDHKPVCSQFNTKYKIIDPEKQKEATSQALEYLKNLKDNVVPKLKIIYPSETENPSVNF